ncbi:predicted protein [Paecilomyces variotii No. 5]|uniref:Myb-like DNA-binding domain-containing protein n=1 Tax=Byssochlamys spectabilis (strain No. 5 / NBRC 109023) TaxID=1356009 RepID=V5FJH7_BYSSN|nr:predicted protein [Paecilomyces variotii No. 5]
MSRVNSDEQFQFLLSCIRYSSNGKVDFGEVAKECNIVSKGAAAKRYERMMKAHGINPNGGGPCPPSASPGSKTNTPTKSPVSAGKANKRQSNGDSPLAKKAKIKKAAVENAEKLVTSKQEDLSDNESKGVATHTAYRSQGAMEDDKDDKDLFDQFCNTADDCAEDEELFA